MGRPNGANQPVTLCAGALGWVSKHLQGAEKQTGRIRQPGKNSYLPTGQAAGHLRPNKLRPNQLKRMPTCSWAVFWNHWHPLRCVLCHPASAWNACSRFVWARSRLLVKRAGRTRARSCTLCSPSLPHASASRLRSTGSATSDLAAVTGKVHHRALALFIEPDTPWSLNLHSSLQLLLGLMSFFLPRDGSVVAASVDSQGTDRALTLKSYDHYSKRAVVQVELWNAASQPDLDDRLANLIQ